ncbi:bifunctional adenosylcobinamide kinase/adenosylcobinamide-phosphate guanylyltransferase [Phaeobacter sp.]|uniref:bifunctional adenosylcobinamide kinase/adenosylcobinamide-phosphate guanylyltransferase n=1 Tax=Phaeobacter sp. TaxID=1902409 RepID=UPI0025E91B37|nr:bifunctional adenosylcobinamide kinase/adenosylcobinamide-phosphate guanylyltransferase [Phaeobacter sp.]
MASKLTLVVGGAASGKSAFAEQLCLGTARPRVYLATSQIWDDEMQAKVARHLVQRGACWTTHEAPLDLGPVLTGLAADSICLLDCATMWLSNHLLADHDLERAQADLIAALTICPAEVVVVTNETGQGIVPDNKLARQFREAQGRLNILLAQTADTVVQVSVGLPHVLKGQL